MNQTNHNGKNNKYITAIISFVLVVAVFAGVGIMNSSGRKKQEEKAPEIRMEQQKPQNGTAAPKSSMALPEVQTKAVDSNKNAPAKAPVVTPEKAAPQETAKAASPEPQPEPIAETAMEAPPKVLEEQETEAAGNFEDGGRLSWPIEGNIVMDYSIDRAIYDVTLEQYRTNDSVCIQAEEGTPVKASADGVVAFVGVDSEKGNTVVIEHQDGWATTYSQLAEEISVKEGQNVAAGQEIGTIGAPSKYSVLLGSHLDFKVSREDQSMDPKVALAQ